MVVSGPDGDKGWSSSQFRVLYAGIFYNRLSGRAGRPAVSSHPAEAYRPGIGAKNQGFLAENQCFSGKKRKKLGIPLPAVALSRGVREQSTTIGGRKPVFLFMGRSAYKSELLTLHPHKTKTPHFRAAPIGVDCIARRGRDS